MFDAGREIFVPYTRVPVHPQLTTSMTDVNVECGRAEKPYRHRGFPTPAPSVGGEGNHHAGPCFSTSPACLHNLTSAAARPRNRLPAYMVRLDWFMQPAPPLHGAGARHTHTCVPRRSPPVPHPSEGRAHETVLCTDALPGQGRSFLAPLVPDIWTIDSQFHDVFGMSPWCAVDDLRACVGLERWDQRAGRADHEAPYRGSLSWSGVMCARRSPILMEMTRWSGRL